RAVVAVVREEGPRYWPGAIRRAQGHLLRGQLLDQPMEESATGIEVVDADPLVAAVRAALAEEQPRHAVAGNAGSPQPAAVGGAGAHGGDHDRARPHVARDALDPGQQGG